ncbi:MAG: hypothetical protein ACI83B_001212 [Sediminicola sp.]|jgi:hypothetical protein
MTSKISTRDQQYVKTILVLCLIESVCVLHHQTNKGFKSDLYELKPLLIFIMFDQETVLNQDCSYTGCC